MHLRRFLTKAENLSEELRFIDYRITKLELLGETMINCDFTGADVIMETLPKNGAKAIITPIYPVGFSRRSLENIPPDEDTLTTSDPQPVGFQRVYVPSELQDSGLLTIFFEVNRSTLLAMIDTTITKLKERKRQIFAESRALIEKPH